MAKQCDRCNGSGSINYLNKEKKARKEKCPDCSGLGKIIKTEKKNGVFITERPEILYGRDHLFNYYIEDRCKSYIKTKIRGIQKIMDNKRKLLDRSGIEKLKRKMNNFNRWRSAPLIPRELENYIIHDDYLVIDIENMGVSNKKDHGKGYMYSNIKVAQKFMSNIVRYIMTNWDDSTKAGRKYLQRQGFKRKNNILIWRNPAHETEYGFLQTPGSDEGNVSNTITKMVEGRGQEGSDIEDTNNTGIETQHNVPNSKLDL